MLVHYRSSMHKHTDFRPQAQAISWILTQRTGIAIALAVEASIISAILLLKY